MFRKSSIRLSVECKVSTKSTTKQLWRIKPTLYQRSTSPMANKKPFTPLGSISETTSRLRQKLHGFWTGVVCWGVVLLLALSVLLHYCAQFWWLSVLWSLSGDLTFRICADCAQRELDRTVGLPAELLHWRSYTFMNLWWVTFYWGQRTRSWQKSNGFTAER